MTAFAAGTFAALLDAAPDAMLCAYADGRIAFVNSEVEMLFGYPREDLIGQPVEMLVLEADRGVHREHWADYAGKPRRRPVAAGMELAGRRRDGSTFPAEISLSAVTTDEGFLITAAVRDGTSRLHAQAERERLRGEAVQERAELKLQQSQRMESLGQLAGGIAHDFNNLLGVISNYSVFVREEIAKDPAQIRWQEVRDDIGQVERAAERAAGLTRQLLAFARREMLQPRVLNVNELIVDVRELLVRTLGEHVELVTELADDVGHVLADRGQIEQVLVNLAVNARDAMSAGGTLTIETANADVDVDEIAACGQEVGLEPGQYVCVKVSDTGTGMPQKVIDRVFEPFFSTKPKSEGTGLGLATAYGIIQQAGGNLRIYSEEGRGTRVTILLPVTAHPAHADEPSPPDLGGGDGQVVLVVEDEPPMREVTRRLLDRNGYEVLAVSSGLEAIELVAGYQSPIDLLVTDIVMPHMLGKDVAERVQSMRPDIGVLFMSGYTQGLLGPQGVLEPSLHLIAKPFAEATLLSKVREVLAARRR